LWRGRTEESIVESVVEKKDWGEYCGEKGLKRILQRERTGENIVEVRD